MFLLPVFIGFLWLKQNTPIQLFDTRIGMILVYTAFFTPVAIYFMRSFFLAIPRDLEEAAQVDGCTPFGASCGSCCPPPRPGLVATFVYAFLFAWDELLFVAALTQTQRRDAPARHPPLHRQLQPTTAQLMAAGVVSTIPVVHRLLRRAALARAGITAGAVKG